MFYDTFDSSVGKITIASDKNILCEIHIIGDKYFKKVPASWIRDKKQSILIKTKKQLNEYFEKKRKTFDIPLMFSGTEFQKKVWHALEDIPPGKTISYKKLAEIIHYPKAVRAVGTALGHNKLCIVLPCHRVIASNGSLGGYAAGITIKKRLLSLEQ